MCSAGGPPDFDLDSGELKFEKYKCKECHGDFRGAGKKPVCPVCGSEKVDLE